MKLVNALLILSLVAFAGVAGAATPVDGSIRDGKTIGETIPGRYDFVEGWNEDQPFDGSWSYGAPCQGPVYVAGETYALERVEFMAGGGTGPAVIEIRADDGSGCPTGPVLATGSFDMVDATSWQGADLDQPVDIFAGQTYHINYQVVVESYSSFATSGEVIPHCWSWDCATWEGPSTSFYWMAKFYGTPPVQTEASAWSLIKALYR